jgi:EAL domain-containing protein (putative c-di-GMP-specific phosphodiesterase class I)
LARAGQEADSESLLRDADTAMYRAKDNGRARCEIFDEGMRLRASERLEVQNELRRALQNGEIVPWYQPVVDLRTGRTVGCEALARWQHPDRGLLQPDAFIPHAEETGAIVALGEGVLLEACRQVAIWNSDRPVGEALTMAVNVSARQLASAQLVDTVREALELSGLHAGHLCLEITESVVMEDVEVSGAVLGRLRDLGVRTAVDDFGTGYSSLAYLLSLPVDVLKIDRSFVQYLDANDGPAVAIVRAITALADALGLGVLAEGVETPQQLGLLEVLGVQQGQGYLWGKAVPAQEATWAVWQPVPTPRKTADLSRDLSLDAGRYL